MRTRGWWEFLGDLVYRAGSIFSASAPVQNDGPKNDELGVFEQSVQEEIQKLRDAQSVWRNEIVRLLGAEESSSPSLSAAHVHTDVSGGLLQDALNSLKEDILELLRTPSAQMKALTDRMKPKFKLQKQHVDELIKQLHAATDPEVQKNIKVQICKINIKLIENFIALIIDVKAKIQSSITIDVMSEEVGLSLFGATMFLLAQITFPQVDMVQETRDCMGRSIRENAQKLDKLLTAFEGELALALRHVTSDTVEAPHADASVDAEAETPEVQARAAVLAAAAAAVIPAAESATAPTSAVGMFARGGDAVRAALRASNDVAPDVQTENTNRLTG